MNEPCMCGGCRSCLGPPQCAECGMNEDEDNQLVRYYGDDLCEDCFAKFEAADAAEAKDETEKEYRRLRNEN